MEWIEVTDTAVKIGLGALITGTTAYFMTRKSHNHELKKESWKKRQSTLETLSDSFETIHTFLLDRCSTNFFKPIRVTTVGSSIDNPKDPEDVCLKKTKEAFLKIHQLEGRLLLADMAQAAKILRNYRLKATEIEDFPITSSDTPKKLEPIAEDLCSIKESFYREISPQYNNA